MPLQLLDLTSEMQLMDAVLDGDTVTSVPIKGFASVEIIDREGEIVNPLEFDVETFMNSPTLLENHKFLKDEFGNEQSAGKVTSAIPAFIAEALSETEWVIKSLKTQEAINTLRKDKVPNLKIGDRGLFVTAEVTNPMTIKKVLNGELGGLSWRGLSLAVKEKNAIRLKGIDLFEISLVNIPAVSQSTFMVGKSAADKSSWQEINRGSVRAFQMRFDKSRFADSDTVEKYLEKHNLKSQTITETDDQYFAVLERPSLFEIEKSFSIPMGSVSVIVAPFKDEDMTSVAELVGHVKTHPVKRDSKMPESAKVEEKTVQKLYLLDENFLTQFPKSTVTLQKSADLEDGSKLEVYSYQFVPEDSAANATETVTTETSTEASKAEEADKEAEVSNGNDALIAGLNKQLQELRDMVAALQAKQEKTPEQQAQEEAQSLKDKIDQATAAAAESQKKLELAVAAFNKLVPAQMTRTETLKSAKNDKTNESEKVGDIFASVLPFTG